MISSTDLPKITDHMGQLFSMAVGSKINLEAITYSIERSDFAAELQASRCGQLVNSTAEELFESLFGRADSGLSRLSYDGTYDDAYWCGWAYTQLLFETRLPLPYLFLVLPLERMLDLYPVYHEMDITQLIDLLEAERREETLMKRLLKRHGVKVPALSLQSGVSPNTINHYKKSDENLYAAGFQNVFRLAQALDVPPELFLQRLPLEVEK